MHMISRYCWNINYLNAYAPNKKFSEILLNIVSVIYRSKAILGSNILFHNEVPYEF